MKRKALAMILTVAMAVTMTPWWSSGYTAYAAEEENVETEQPTEQLTEEAAWEQLEQFTAAYQQAQQNCQTAEGAYNDANAEFEDADGDYKQAKADSDQADQALSDAQAALQAAEQALENANGRKANAQNNYDTAQTNLNKKVEAKEDAEEAVNLAQSALTQANTRWTQAKSAADSNLTQAQEAMDNAGYNFINSKVSALGSKYYTIDQIIQNESSSSYGVTAWDGTTPISMQGIITDENFNKIVHEACSYDNLKQGIELMKHTNALRTNARHNLSALPVNYQLIANGIVSAAVASYARGHVLIDSSNYKYWTIDTPQNYRPRNEDLAYSTSPIGGYYEYDPFDGWYYEERIVQLGKDNGGVTQAIINQVINEAYADGSTFDPYRDGTTQEAYLEQMQNSTTTGHYLAIIEPQLTAQGAAYTDTSPEYAKSFMKYQGRWLFSVKSALEFNNTTRNTISLSQYESDLDSYFNNYINDLAAAQTTVNNLQTAPDYVVSAQNTLTQKQNELKAAQSALATAQADMNAAQTELMNASQEVDNKKQAKSMAETAVNKAQQTAGEKARAASDALEIRNSKETAKNTAKDNWDKAKTVENQAKASMNSAKAIYDAFFALDNASADAVDDAVYTGTEITPALTIHNKGNTKVLTEEDYTLSYQNNTNVGEAVITAQGQGQYTGSLTAKFNITPADIADAAIAAITDQEYTQGELTPVPKMTYNGKRLVSGTDFTLTYQDNIEIGTAKITITGQGNFKGTTECEFQIVAPKPDDGGYSELPSAAKETVDKIIDGLGMDAKAAMAVYNYGKDANIPVETLLITSDTLTKGNTDTDVKGSRFCPLKARAAKVGKTYVTLKWTRFAKADGYMIYGSLCGKTRKCTLIKTIKDKDTVSFTKKKLKAGKYYKYVVVAYRNIGGKKITIAASPTVHEATLGGKVTNTKKVTTKAKKNQVSLKVSGTFKLGAKAVKVSSKLKYQTHRGLRYTSTNPKVAKVSSKGTIKGVKKGSCYVYAYAQNGTAAKIKVIVK